MMNIRIRSLIDEIFSEMKMTADNLALRDELLANAHARYEDMIARGRSEEEAIMEVAASLEDVYGLIEEMNRMGDRPAAKETEEEVPELKTGTEAEPAAEAEKDENGADRTDLGSALDKAFSVLGDLSQAVMPEARKLAGQMNEATGGMLGRLGRAAKKGVKSVQKAMDEALVRGEGGEMVFDFGKNREAVKEEPVSDFGTVTEPADETPRTDGEIVMEIPEQEALADPQAEAGKLRGEAETLRAQATFKDMTGDSEAARALRAQAEALEMQAEMKEQMRFAADAMEEAAPEAQEEEGWIGEDGEINTEAFSEAVDRMTQDAEDVIRAASGADCGSTEEAGCTARICGSRSFPSAGLRKVDIGLDADDVEIVCGQGAETEVFWETDRSEGEPAVTFAGHTLTIRRKNPDVFKTFFSVFKKEGGRITVRVPQGFAADYVIGTTSGDVHLHGVDVDNVKVNTTSGSVRIEPDVQARAKEIEVTSVSGHADISASADKIEASTVSGGQNISCDAHKVDVKAVSGKVRVQGACDEWEVSVVSGEAELLCTAAPTRKVKISSVHGDVRLALPGDIRGFSAEATGALGCEIINEFGADRYGTCALPIRMETMHGKLLITRL